MTKNLWDVVIIGGGAGGLAAAVRTSQLGTRVAVIERDHLGGICMNRGCIPTRTLMETARLFRAIRRAKEFGLRVSEVEVDWDSLMAKKDDMVEYLRLGAEALLRSNGVEVFNGDAAFRGPHLIRVGQRELKAKTVIIATGSRWVPPPIAGIQHEGVMTTDGVLSMREMPSSVAVIGGGPVELEIAQYLLFVGCRVTILEEAGHLLPQEDRAAGGRLAGVLREQGMTILTRVRVLEIQEREAGLGIRLEGQEGEREISVQRVVYAKRAPCLDGLELQKAGLTASEDGIEVDHFLRTSVPHVYAIGDVTGAPMYSHRASAMGITAAENALGKTHAIRQETISRAFCTWPEMASVGLTEREAIDKGYNLKVATIPYSVNPKAMIMLETDGAVKVIAESSYGEILGVHIVGPHATELISEGALAIELEATVSDLARAMRYHPSLSESQVEAAREAMGQGIYVLR